MQRQPLKLCIPHVNAKTRVTENVGEDGATRPKAKFDEKKSQKVVNTERSIEYAQRERERMMVN